MADAQFRINITGDAAGLKAATMEARDGIKGIATDTTTTGDVGKKSWQDMLGQLKLTGAGHHEMAQSVRALRGEFPELYHVAHMALHPITLATFGVIGAWELWQKRIEECEEILGAKLDLPGGTALEPERISALSEMWHKYGVAMQEAFGGLKGVEQSSKRILDEITAALARKKELIDAQKAIDEARGKPGAAASADDQKRHAGEQARAADLEEKENEAAWLDVQSQIAAEAAGKIKLPSKEQDTKSQEAYNKGAEAAAEDRKKAEESAGKLVESLAGDITWLNEIGVKMRQLLTGMSREEMLALENARIENDRNIERAARDRAARGPERDRLREEREQAIKQAQEMGLKGHELGEEVTEGWRGLRADMEAGDLAAAMRELAAAITAEHEARQRIEETRRTVAGQVEHTGAAAPNERAKLQAETTYDRALQERIAWLESQLANMRHP